MHPKTTLLLLKTKSTPDAYLTYFTSPTLVDKYIIRFLPVLQHRYNQSAISRIATAVTTGTLSPPNQQTGGLIFTSQRAVDAFAQAIATIREADYDLGALLGPNLPLYVVGPATANALRALNLPPHVRVLGEESGNGEALGRFMLENYSARAPSGVKVPLLFLVGEQRRDVIPRMLQDDRLPMDSRIEVQELIAYETGEREDLAEELDRALHSLEGGDAHLWLVVFSPAGCRATLEALGRLASDGKAKSREDSRVPNAHIATIGPTTRDYLIENFTCTPDAVAGTPSAAGIHAAIEEYIYVQSNASE